MKRLLMIAAALLALTAAASADPLPDAFLGRWYYPSSGVSTCAGRIDKCYEAPKQARPQRIKQPRR
jgi:hypothetical protein